MKGFSLAESVESGIPPDSALPAKGDSPARTIWLPKPHLADKLAPRRWTQCPSSTEEAYTLNDVDLIGRSCGDGLRSDEGNEHFVLAACGPIFTEHTYQRPPYNFGPAKGNGLSCAL